MSQHASTFDVQTVLQSMVPTTLVEHAAGETVFAQGDRANRVVYLQHGRVTLSVRSTRGRDATVATFRRGEFFGEGCLAGQPLRLATATALTTPTRVLSIRKTAMAAALLEQRNFSDYFIAQMLVRNIRIEQQLIRHLFSATEKRLARTLLLLARYGRVEHSEAVLPKVPLSTLSKVLRTKSSNVDDFVEKFKAFGLVKETDGTGVIQVDVALLSIALRD
jgi:CRP/FNR family cyclic AMP-dependent transcriptional regulator